MVAFQLHRRVPFVRRQAQPQDEVAAGQFCRASSAPDFDDYDLVLRIIRAYQKAIETPVGVGAMWDGPLFNLKRDVHDALVGGDIPAVQALSARPEENRSILWVRRSI